jgi:CMP/dCMP kinase
MIITIAGDAGSGKSTVANILVKELNAHRIYIGGIFRLMAKEKGMTIEKFMDYSKDHPEIHYQADEKARDQARVLDKEGKIVIAEGRVLYHFIPESVKIFMKVDSVEGAKRIWQDLNDLQRSETRNEDSVKSLEDARKKIIQRKLKDQERYKKLYHTDIWDESNYDFVLDTTHISAMQAAQQLLDYLKRK